MLTVRVYDNNLIALQDLDTDDIEVCELSKKFIPETNGDMEKLMHVSDTKIIQTTRKSSYFAFMIVKAK